MAHYQVTVDRDLLQGLFVRDDGLARLVEDIVNQILDAQAAEQLRAKPYERPKNGRVTAMDTERGCSSHG